jgi:hypothetical protein
MATSTTHPAILKAQEIYDRLGDLEPGQQALLTAVYRFTMECARTKGEAVRQWGDGSQAYDAVAYLADRKQAAGLAAALEQFEQSFEDHDEIEEIELAMAEAAE